MAALSSGGVLREARPETLSSGGVLRPETQRGNGCIIGRQGLEGKVGELAGRLEGLRQRLEGAEVEIQGTR